MDPKKLVCDAYRNAKYRKLPQKKRSDAFVSCLEEGLNTFYESSSSIRVLWRKSPDRPNEKLGIGRLRTEYPRA